MPSSDQPSWPTLAEAPDSLEGREETPRLVVLLDNVGLDDLPGVLPPDATVVATSGSAEPGVDSVRSLAELRELVGRKCADVLMLSRTEGLRGVDVEALRSCLASDSACASVCFDPDAPPWSEPLPPASVEAPRPGAVLVSRDHLMLALDEAPLLAVATVRLIPPPSAESLVEDALATLVRPGFVHRACGADRRRVAFAPPRPAQSSPVAARVVLDGRGLAFPVSGSQVQFIELLGGLLRAGAEIAVLGPSALHPTCAAALGELRREIPLLRQSQVERVPVFHRPFQIGSLKGLAECLALGDRLVVTQQDMIAARTRAYAATPESWRRFRAATAAVLTSADHLTFFSRHAARDAASDGELDPARATVVPLGVDHVRRGEDAENGPAPLGTQPYLLMVGNSYWHKNRLFALRLVRWLVEHGWDGGLVLAGQHPEPGSSRPAEDVFVRELGLEGRVVDLGHVPDRERRALYVGCELVLFPSLHEGFGLVPFEAAAFGKACMYARKASLRELLPAAGALPSFDIEEAGPSVLTLLESDETRRRVASAIADAGAGLTWDRTAAGYLEVYRRALEQPERVSRPLVRELAPARLSAAEQLLVDVHRRRPAFRAAFDALRGGASALRRARRKRGVEERPG